MVLAGERGSVNAVMDSIKSTTEGTVSRQVLLCVAGKVDGFLFKQLDLQILTKGSSRNLVCVWVWSERVDAGFGGCDCGSSS